MTHKTTMPRMLSRGAAFGLQAGVLVWIILLLQQAMAAQGDKLNTVHHVTFGPLVLMSLGKRQVENQVAASFHFEDGLLVYFAGWLIAGATVAAVVRWLLTRGPQLPTEIDSAD